VSDKPLLTGVAGGSGSGKTTVSTAIADAVGTHRVAILAEDAYYREYGHLPEAERATINYDHPDTIETELLLSHLHALLEGAAIQRPIYDFTTYTRRLETHRVEPRPVLIVEGILILADATLRQLLDIKVFVDADADLRFIRRLTRDVHERGRSVDSVITQYLSTVRPMHLAFVEPSKRYADIIVPEGGQNRVAIDLLRSAILYALRQRQDEWD